MSQTKVVKGKARQEKPLRVMHKIENGSITSRTVDPKAPKLREATGPKDKVQQAEETAHKVPKSGDVSELDHKILKALNDLGGKDLASIDIAKKAGTTRTHPDAPRAPVRGAMERFEKLGYVKSEKKGIKYLFSITEKGKHFLTNPPKPQDKPKDKASTASSGSNDSKPAPKATESKTVSVPPPIGLKEGVLNAVGRVVPAAIPANTDRQCQACKTSNPYMAEFCKNCGQSLKVKAAPVAA